jgi:ssRNA-specific RNase YbeY (16S rRNA maturation enzyme)
MHSKIDLQNDESLTGVPDKQDLEAWVDSALLQNFENLEQTIRVVGIAESRVLNLQYRMVDAPTNVLSFVTDNE